MVPPGPEPSGKILPPFPPFRFEKTGRLAPFRSYFCTSGTHSSGVNRYTKQVANFGSDRAQW